MTDDELTAYHEAGHAVMALHHGRTIHLVSARPSSRWLGVCHFGKGRTKTPADVVEAEILIALSGMAAEKMAGGSYNLLGAGSDIDLAGVWAGDRAGRNAERLLQRMLDKAEHILGKPHLWNAVTAIAKELGLKTELSGRAARHLFDLSIKADLD